MKPKLEMGSLFLKKDFNFPEIPPLEINLDDTPNYVKSINFPLSADAEFELEAEIDAPGLSRLIGIDLANAKDFSVQFSEPYQEQVRRHKKKRINKKWAKRYGYRTKTKIRQINEVTFKSAGPGEYEFVGREIDILKGE